MKSMTERIKLKEEQLTINSEFLQMNPIVFLLHDLENIPLIEII